MKKPLITLEQASKTKYYRTPVNIQVHITGKAVLPYQIPKKIKIQCKPKRSCGNCYIKKNKTNLLFLKKNNPELIKFINTNEIHFGNIIKKMYDIPYRCDLKYDITDVYTIEEVYLNELHRENIKSNISRIGYCINTSLETNNIYMIDCFTYPEPKSQKIVNIITNSKKIKSNIECFELTLKEKKILNKFNPLYKNKKSDENDVNIIYSFLEKLYEIYSGNVTRIYKRFDLHMAIDLVFHSPLQFYFNNEFVHKGWLETMIIGDTRCGKGFVSESFVKYYNFGEIVSGENVSFAGLVGGIQQISGRWVATWGKIPLNNRKLVIIDESGEIDPKDFSRLSRIRSEGIAEITKIHTERTQAMTRLIFLTNPKNRMVNTYSFGIETVNDLIENAEDISRFDYILVVSQNEVNISEINKTRKIVSNPYEEIDPILIQWIWSRKPEQIIFEKETTDTILKLAIKLGNIYSSKIPLIQGENIRIKLAKISAAIAGRLFSHDKNDLVVKSSHVKAAYVFLNMIYKKPCSGYYYLSQLHKETQEIYNQGSFEDYINSFENKPDLIHYFISNNYITVTDISECINQPKEIAKEIISKLLHHRCVTKRYTFYVKNQCFNNWLRKH
ncbi:MAG TPA: hypothetical protein ENG87_05995 [Candidatus Pacearchaeota archaeon]|nr:hypothetical protein [Candidatus Pacearchaeota archaeon]